MVDDRSADNAALPSQLRRGVLEFCVLALLRDGERYAVELVQELGSKDGLVTSEGTLYPLLSRLRKEGVVETTWRESPGGPCCTCSTRNGRGSATPWIGSSGNERDQEPAR